MAKPIVLTNDLIEQMKSEFEAKLRSAKLADGKLTYTKTFSYKNDQSKVRVMFTPLAYLKMILILQHCSDEVAWHGFVERQSEDLFMITDIEVYPQTVTGATVNTDQEEYQRWLMDLDDDRANTMHMQGHSHVRFSCTPSSTDLHHQEQIIAQLSGQGFYIFMIWNKGLDHNIKVYDLASNTLFEDEDVEVGVLGEGFDMKSFIENIDNLVIKEKTYSYGEVHQATTDSTSKVKKKKFVTKSSEPSAAQKTASSSRSQGSRGSYGGWPYNERDLPDYDALIYGGRFDT